MLKKGRADASSTVTAEEYYGTPVFLARNPSHLDGAGEPGRVDGL